MRSRPAAAAAAFYVALTLLLTYPFSTRLATHVLSVGTDMDLAIWTIGWDVHAFTHQPWKIFDANIFYPFHNSLAYSENLIGSAIIAAPVLWLTDNTILAMNVVVLLSVMLSAFGAFLLARRLGLSTMAALLAGIVFGFAPPKFFRTDQLPISTVQWIPFTLLALHVYFDTHKARYLRIAIALFSLQAVTSGHGAAMLTLAVAMLLIWKWLTGEPAAFVQRFRDVGWQGALALVPALLIYIPYKFAQIEIGLKRELEDWTLATSSFFTSPTFVHEWLRAHAPDWHWLKGEADAWLFPGIVPIVLAIAALWSHAALAAPAEPGRAWRRVALALEWLAALMLGFAAWVTMSGGVTVRSGGAIVFSSHGATPWIQCALLFVLRIALYRKAPLAISPRIDRARRWFTVWRRSFNTRDHLWFYTSMLALCYWLAIGPPLGIWRWMYWMPGLNFVRVPSRFTVLGMLALGLIAASGFDRLTARVKRGARIAIFAACALCLVAEFATWPLGTEPYAVDPPAIDRWVSTQPENMALLEMPLADSLLVPRRERWTTNFMLHSMAHWKPLFVGFSGIQPPGYQDNYWKLVKFPDTESMAVARKLGLTHVILHTSLIHPTEVEETEARFARFADQLTLVHTEGEGRLYAIRP